MNNKENMQHTVLNKQSQSVGSNLDQISINGASNVDKKNGNQGSTEYDNTGYVLTVKNDNTMKNSQLNVAKKCDDVQSGNTTDVTPMTEYRLSNKVQNNQINTSTNLRKSQMAKSNPHLNVVSSYVDMHPLSNSLMDTSRNDLRLLGNRTDVVGRNSLNAQSRYSQSSNQISDDAIQRITRQFTPLQIPIVGYEVMEERARFTIYKLRIDDPRTGLSWMVFRRYTDFVRLYQKLKMEHRDLILPLPEKRLFRNNFDPSFLEDRSRGLQVFVNAVVKKLSLDRNVREFFCLDEPPDIADSEPEAQALFGAMEDTVGGLKNQMKQQEETIKYLRHKIFYLEEKMKSCSVCNPLGAINTGVSLAGHSPMSSASSNGS